MKTKLLFTALLTFLMVHGKAIHTNSTLVIDVREQPNKTYVVVLEDGTEIESHRDILLNRMRAGRTGIQIYKRTYRVNRRGQERFNELLVFNGFVRVPRNSKVYAQLIAGNLVTRRIVNKPIGNGPDFGRARGMHPQIFGELKQAVVNESFDNNKLGLLEVATQNNNFTSQQVAEIMRLLSFDSNKIQFAKRAYRHTVNPQSYFLVRNELTFSSYKRQLDNYIMEQGNTNRDRNRDRRR